MRSVSTDFGGSLSINAGENGKNLISDLKVHKNLQTNDEIKKVKINRGTNVTISAWAADVRSTT